MFVAEEIRRERCPVCSGAIAPSFRKRRADSTYEIFRCTQCGFNLVNPTPSAAEIVRFYVEGGGHGAGRVRSYEEVMRAEETEPNSTLDAERIATSLSGMTRGRELLDVGCGYGFFAAAAIRRGFTVHAIEVAPAERAIAERLLGMPVEPVTFEDFAPPRRYDALIMSQILEHAREPDRWAVKALSCLSPGGVICIALPNFGSFVTRVLRSRDPYVIPPAHLNYFTPSSLSLLLAKAGFEVLRVETLSRMPLAPFRKITRGLAPRQAQAAFHSVSRVLDKRGLGIMINIYARRP